MPPDDEEFGREQPVRWTGQSARLAGWRDDDAARGERAAPGQPGAHDPAGMSALWSRDPLGNQRDESDLHETNETHATAPDFALDMARHSAGVGESDEQRAEFTALIDAHATTLARVAAALVGVSDAEDAAQEAIVRAWRAWSDLRDRSAARAWLISITINVCRDWLRGRFGARRRLTESLNGAGDESRIIAQLDADPGASDHAAALDLRHAITTLDDDLRILVALRYYAGMDSTAIGAALGMPAATVRTRLRRALAQLRTRLSGAHAASPDPVNDPNDTEGRR